MDTLNKTIDISTTTPPVTTTTTEPAEAPKILHDISGRESLCLFCHGEQAAEPLRFPDDHIGRNVDECLSCHEPAVAITTITPTPTTTPTPTPTPTVIFTLIPHEPGESPLIPHPLQEYRDCALCHVDPTNLGSIIKIYEGHHCDQCHEILSGWEHGSPQNNACTMFGCHQLP